MNTLMKLSRVMLALTLVCSLILGMGAGSLCAIAADNDEQVSGKNAILEEFFGEDVKPEEAYDNVIAQADQMNDYENLKYQYVSNDDSYYVALGDETAAVTKRQKSTYVDKLADMLGISYKNLAAAQMTIQEVYSTITDNSKEIAKADLITIGWSNYSATYFMCQYMSQKAERVTEQQWSELVGKENLPKVDELLNAMFQMLRDKDLSNFEGYDLEGGLECYAYAYLSNAIHQSQVIESIRVFNKNAVIVLVGTYNDLEGIALTTNGEQVDLGEMMRDLVNASNLLATKNAANYARVAYVHAPDVKTTLDKNAKDYSTPQQYVLAIVGRQGLPNEEGHKYIAKQIKSVFTNVCGHFWDEGQVATEAACLTDGEMLFTCTWCGEQRTEGIAATGHTWDDGVVTKEPTATQDGEKTYTCSGCGEKKTEVIEKTGEDTVIVGDVNGDGRLNSRDARALLRYIAGLSDDGQITDDVADFNGDGRVNSRDARALLRYIAGLD